MTSQTEYSVNVEAEQAVIGSILLDATFAKPYVMKLQRQDFTESTRQAVFDAYMDGCIDILAISEHVAKNTQISSSDVTLKLSDYLMAVPSALNIETYVDLVIKAAEIRRGTNVLSNGVKKLLNGGEWGEVAMWVGDQLKENRGAVSGRPTSEVAAALFDTVTQWANEPLPKGSVRYPSTGLQALDSITGGLQPGFYILAARPSVGKTALATAIAESVARKELQKMPSERQEVLYFTNEMSDEQLLMRMACAIARVDIRDLQTGSVEPENLNHFFMALDTLQQESLTIINSRSVTEIMGRCYQADNPKLIVIDYLNKMNGGEGENRVQKLGSIASALFDMAYDLQVPVLLLSQLSRDVAKRGKDALPSMEDLRDSGELEQIADILLMLHRVDEYPNELHVFKRKDRLTGGQHTACRLFFGPTGYVADMTTYVPPEGYGKPQDEELEIGWDKYNE